MAKTGKVISLKENFQSTQLYGQVHRFIILWNGRRFDSVDCLHLYEFIVDQLAQVIPGVTDTCRSHRIAKIVVYDSKIGQVKHRTVSLQLLFIINRRFIFLLRQKWKTCLSFLQFDKTVCRLLCVRSSRSSSLRWTFNVFYFQCFFIFTRLALKHFTQLKYFLYFLFLIYLYPIIRFMLLCRLEFA